MRKKGTFALILLLAAVWSLPVRAASEGGVQLVEAADRTWAVQRDAMPGEVIRCRADLTLEGGREYTVRSAFSPGVEFAELTALRCGGKAVNASAYTVLTGRFIPRGAFELRLSSGFAEPGAAMLEIEYAVALTEAAGERSTCGLAVCGDTPAQTADAVIYSRGFCLYRGVAIPDSGKQSNPLPGTCYCLYRDRELLKRVAFVAGENGAYTACAAERCAHRRHAYLLRTGENGTLHIRGLSEGTYYLLESRTPEGHVSMAEGTELRVDSRGGITAGGVPLTDGRLSLVEKPAGYTEAAEERDPLLFYIYGSRVLSALLAVMLAAHRYLFR